MAGTTVTIVCRQRWWLKYYLAGVMATIHLTGLNPDLARVMMWLKRGIVVEVQ
ncbi:hypothetical protein [Pseudomonas sp. CFBP 13727]|uniref:hypothetical protein n=1 Tax=Pseudomonas sp. CFBP 13727 TaxID=2775295 RepID=UPI001785EBDA|nr:hypothetical protein [Pseudomonas sp. CFBP 13727]MBD8621682.1 hypothetical protein [Pseudomonas sp. CFBP 13727]